MLRLAQQRVSVRRIAGSLFESLLGAPYAPYHARWFETDRGIVEALFLGSAASAAELRVCEEVQGSRYRYSLTGGRRMDGSRRLYFALHDGVLTITDSLALDEAIRRMSGAARVAC